MVAQLGPRKSRHNVEQEGANQPPTVHDGLLLQLRFSSSTPKGLRQHTQTGTDSSPSLYLTIIPQSRSSASNKLRESRIRCTTSITIIPLHPRFSPSAPAPLAKLSFCQSNFLDDRAKTQCNSQAAVPARSHPSIGVCLLAVRHRKHRGWPSSCAPRSSAPPLRSPAGRVRPSKKPSPGVTDR